MFALSLIFSIVSAPKWVDYDVIFSLTAGLGKVYPNFFDKPYSLVYKNEEKLRVHLMHTGTPSASGLGISTAPPASV